MGADKNKKPIININLARQFTGSLSLIRERILRGVLRYSVLLGAIILVVSLMIELPRGNWNTAIIYMLAYFGVLFLAFFNNLSYKTRTLGFLLILFGLGVTTTVTTGTAGDGRLWFTGFIIMGGILMGMNAVLTAIGVSLVTYLFIGSLIIWNVISLPQTNISPTPDNFMDWVSAGIIYVIIAGTISISLSVLLQNMNTGYEREHARSVELGKEQLDLFNSKKELERLTKQIQNTLRLTNDINSSSNRDNYLRRTVDMIQKAYDLSFVGIYLLDDNERNVISKARAGDQINYLNSGDTLETLDETSLIGRTAISRLPCIENIVDESESNSGEPGKITTKSMIAIPMIAQDHLLGVIELHSKENEAFDENDYKIFHIFSDSLVASLFNFGSQNISGHDLTFDSVKNAHEFHDPSDHAFVLRDSDNLHGENNILGDRSGDLSEYNFPITLGEDQLGILKLELASKNVSVEDRMFIEQITNHTALALDKAQKLAAQVAGVNRDQLVFEITKAIHSSTDSDEILETSTRKLRELLKAHDVKLRVANDEDQ